uniref:Uncharacterized protein n=1 Tax=Rhizophora mucronata TaxID=61149 RepID=A0A2P2P237_RHIMU
MKPDQSDGRDRTGTRTHTKILLTSLSAMVAETATFPIDLTKTRLQLHGECLSSTRSTNAFRVASEIIREQGFFGLYRGLSPAILRHLFYTPIRIVGYENLRNLVLVNDGSGGGGGFISLPGKALIGGLSGVIAQVSKNFVSSIGKFSILTMFKALETAVSIQWMVVTFRTKLCPDGVVLSLASMNL